MRATGASACSGSARRSGCRSCRQRRRSGNWCSGYVATNWYALFAPRGLPANVSARLQAELAKARDDPALKEKAAAIGMTMMLAPAEALRVRIEAEVPRWQRLIPEVGLKVE